jgi:starvation-inducible DNA-binding protein
MASIATSTHLPVLDEPHEHEAVGHILETTLQELVDLSLIGKQLHWAVADTVAERAVALGYVPDGQARAVSSGSELAAIARSPIDDHVVVRELTHRIAQTSELARGRMDRLGAIDLVSQDILIDVVRTLEEQQWMLRVQLGTQA